MFESPSSDYAELPLSLDKYLVQNPSATYFMRVSGDAMEGVGIYNEDLLVVDKSLTPRDNDIVVAILDDEFLLRRLSEKQGVVSLLSANPKYHTIVVQPGQKFEVWGVVAHNIHKLF